MRFSSDPLIAQFLKKYDSISERDREQLSIEAISLAADIDVRHLWGEMILAMREESLSRVKAMAVSNHPEIVTKRIEFAKTPGGYRDRDAIDTILGILPSTKGISIMNKIFTGNSSMPEGEADSVPQVEKFDDDLDVVFPDVSQMQEKLHPLRNRMLPAGK